MVSAFEPARLSLCGVDEHAAIAEALKAKDVERAIALSGERFLPHRASPGAGRGRALGQTMEEALGPLAGGARKPRGASGTREAASTVIASEAKRSSFRDC